MPFENVAFRDQVEEEGDVLHNANILTYQRRREITDVYRQKLLVAEIAIEANRFILNLETVLTAKAKAGEDVSEPLGKVEECRRRLIEALRSGNSTDIVDIEGTVEQLTLSFDHLYLENEDKRREQRRIDIEERGKATWMSHSSNRVIQLMKGDRKGEVKVTREERRSCTSKAAWTFAISGMVIAIAFVVADFYTSQKNPVLRTSLIAQKKLELPITTYCMGFPNIGSFQDADTLGIRGKALFGVTLADNFETSESFSSDEAHKTLFEPVTLGPETCKDNLKSFTTEQMQFQHPFNTSTAPSASGACYSCFRTRKFSAVKLLADKALAIGRPPVRVKLARSNVLPYCFSGVSFHHDIFTRDALVNLLIAHADALEKEGVLSNDMGTLASALTALKTYTRPTSTAALVEEVQSTAGFLCNVYFFSGFFFPISGTIEVKYKYGDGGTSNPLNRRWIQNGAGPFHRIYFEDSAAVVSAQTMTEELARTNAQDTSARTRVFVYALDSSLDRLPDIKDHVVSLSDRKPVILFFTRSLDHGEPGYKAEATIGRRLLAFENAMFADYALEMGFSSFNMQVTTRRPATSVAEFLSDVFEYAGLFTGICAYSILVAPARMYLRRPATTQAKNNRNM
jgi:hypothetical protein